jgi:hypothetical protein
MCMPFLKKIGACRLITTPSLFECCTLFSKLSKPFAAHCIELWTTMMVLVALTLRSAALLKYYRSLPAIFMKLRNSFRL